MASFLDPLPQPNTKSDRVRHFIKDVGLPLNRAPEALGMTATDFMLWWSGQKKKIIQNQNILQLGQFFNIHETDILDGSYNKDFVRSVLFSGAALPEKYLRNQFSALRTSAHIIKYVTITRGQHFSDMILRKLNVSPVIYSDHDNKISLNYFVDLLAMLGENGFSDDEIDHLACVMFLSLGPTPIGKRFSLAKTYYDCYEILSQVVHVFEANFEYSFKVDRSQATLRAFLPFDNHTHIDWSQTKLDRLFRYRRILMGWWPFLSKLPPIIPKVDFKYLAGGIEATYQIIFSDYIPSPIYLIPTQHMK